MQILWVIVETIGAVQSAALRGLQFIFKPTCLCASAVILILLLIVTPLTAFVLLSFLAKSALLIVALFFFGWVGSIATGAAAIGWDDDRISNTVFRRTLLFWMYGPWMIMFVGGFALVPAAFLKLCYALVSGKWDTVTSWNAL